MNRECPAGCGREVRPGKLVCGRCWKRVPRKVQTAYFATWNQLQDARRHGATDRTRSALARYELAARGVIAAARSALVG